MPSQSQSLEWPYKKVVFGTLLGMGYAAAFVAVVYPFYMYSLG